MSILFEVPPTKSLQGIYKYIIRFMIQKCSRIMYMYLNIYNFIITIIILSIFILLLISLNSTCTMLTCVII
jgi:hypothetical protein